MRGAGTNRVVIEGAGRVPEFPNSRIYARRRQASALIIVLWTIGLMGLLVMSFAFDAHLEAKIISYYRKRTRAGYLAQSGIEIAKLLMAKAPRVDLQASQEPDPEDPWQPDARALALGRMERAYPLGEGEVELTISTEKARIGVNALVREEQWESIFNVVGVPEDIWPDLIDAFMDWTDADDAARPKGAETEDYYNTLKPPYRARNGPLVSVEELLMIKGFSRAIVFGGVLDPEDENSEVIAGDGLSGLLTLYGDEKINVNAADFDVLLTLPNTYGDPVLLAQAVLEERATSTNRTTGFVGGGPFLDEADMCRRVPELCDPERRPYVTTESSKYYRITSRGRVQNVARTVVCTAQLDGEITTFLRWEEAQ